MCSTLPGSVDKININQYVAALVNEFLYMYVFDLKKIRSLCAVLAHST